MLIYKYITEPAKRRKFTATVDDLYALHMCGFYISYNRVVFENVNGVTVERATNSYDCMNRLLGTYTHSAKNIHIDLYTEDSFYYNSPDDLNYVLALEKVNIFKCSRLDNYVLELLKTLDLKNLSFAELVTKMYNRKLYNININSVSLLSDIVFKDGYRCSVYDYIYTCKYYIYNI